MIEYDYKLEILGDPKAQGRPRARRMGKFVSVYDDPKSAKAKKTLQAVVQENAPKELLNSALRVDLYFYLPRPKGHFRTGRYANQLKESFCYIHHTKRPDIDNLRKLVMDALTGVFWRDDSLVCVGLTIKEYSIKPRTEIFIKILKEISHDVQGMSERK
tara:strand:+ start:2634 stop:3110 length:477 start_codon:yes stop_codon:yes gene_type:complete